MWHHDEDNVLLSTASPGVKYIIQKGEISIILTFQLSFNQQVHWSKEPHMFAAQCA